MRHVLSIYHSSVMASLAGQLIGIITCPTARGELFRALAIAPYVLTLPCGIAEHICSRKPLVCQAPPKHWYQHVATRAVCAMCIGFTGSIATGCTSRMHMLDPGHVALIV